MSSLFRNLRRYRDYSAAGLQLGTEGREKNQLKKAALSDQTEEHQREIGDFVRGVLESQIKECHQSVSQDEKGVSESNRIKKLISSLEKIQEIEEFFQSTLARELPLNTKELGRSVEEDKATSLKKLTLEVELLCRDMQESPEKYIQSPKKMISICEDVLVPLEEKNDPEAIHLSQILLPLWSDLLKKQQLLMLEQFCENAPKVKEQFILLDEPSKQLLAIRVYEMYGMHVSDLTDLKSSPATIANQENVLNFISKLKRLERVQEKTKQKVMELSNLPNSIYTARMIVESVVDIIQETPGSEIIDALHLYAETVQSDYRQYSSKRRIQLINLLSSGGNMPSGERERALLSIIRFFTRNVELGSVCLESKWYLEDIFSNYHQLESESEFLSNIRGNTFGKTIFLESLKDIQFGELLQGLVEGIPVEKSEIFGTLFSLMGGSNNKPRFELLATELIALLPDKRLEKVTILIDFLLTIEIKGREQLTHYIAKLPHEIIQEVRAFKNAEGKALSKNKLSEFLTDKGEIALLELVLSPYVDPEAPDKIVASLPDHPETLKKVRLLMSHLTGQKIDDAQPMIETMRQMKLFNPVYQKKLIQLFEYATSDPELFEELLDIISVSTYPILFSSLVGCAGVDRENTRSLIRFLNADPKRCELFLSGIFDEKSKLLPFIGKISESTLVFLLDKAYFMGRFEFEQLFNDPVAFVKNCKQIQQIETMDQSPVIWNKKIQFGMLEKYFQLPAETLDLISSSKEVRELVRSKGIRILSVYSTPIEDWQKDPTFVTSYVNCIQDWGLNAKKAYVLESLYKRALNGNLEIKEALNGFFHTVKLHPGMREVLFEQLSAENFSIIQAINDILGEEKTNENSWKVIENDLWKNPEVKQGAQDWLSTLLSSCGKVFDATQSLEKNLEGFPFNQETLLSVFCLVNIRMNWVKEVLKLTKEFPHPNDLQPLIGFMIHMNDEEVRRLVPLIIEYPQIIPELKSSNIQWESPNQFRHDLQDMLMSTLPLRAVLFLSPSGYYFASIIKEMDDEKILKLVDLKNVAPLSMLYQVQIENYDWFKANPDIHRLLSKAKNGSISLSEVQKRPDLWKRVLQAGHQHSDLSLFTNEQNLMDLYEKLDPLETKVEQKIISDILALIRYGKKEIAERVLQVGVEGKTEQMQRLFDLAAAGYLPEVSSLLDRQDEAEVQELLKRVDSGSGQDLVYFCKNLSPPSKPEWVRAEGVNPDVYQIEDSLKLVFKEIDEATFPDEVRRKLAKETAFAINVAKFLVAPNGVIRRELVPAIRNLDFIQSTLDPSCDLFQYLDHVLTVLESEPRITQIIMESKKPVQNAGPAYRMIRRTLQLAEGEEVTDHHARVVIVSALLSRPRQSPGVGSCFATQSCILSHSTAEKLVNATEDYRQIIENQFLERRIYEKTLEIIQYPLQINEQAYREEFLIENPLLKSLEAVLSSSVSGNMDIKKLFLPDQFMYRDEMLAISSLWVKGFPFKDLLGSEVLSSIQSHILENTRVIGDFHRVHPETNQIGLWILCRRDTGEEIDSLEKYQKLFVESIAVAMTEFFQKNYPAVPSDFYQPIIKKYQSIVLEKQYSIDHWFRQTWGGTTDKVIKVKEQRPQQVISQKISFKDSEEGVLGLFHYLRGVPEVMRREYCRSGSISAEPFIIEGHALTLRPQKVFQLMDQYATDEEVLQSFRNSSIQAHEKCRIDAKIAREVIETCSNILPENQREIFKQIEIQEGCSIAELGRLIREKLAVLQGKNLDRDILRKMENAIQSRLPKEIKEVLPCLPFGDLNWNSSQKEYSNIYLLAGLGIISDKMDFYWGDFKGHDRYVYSTNLERFGWTFYQPVLRRAEGMVTYEDMGGNLQSNANGGG